MRYYKVTIIYQGGSLVQSTIDELPMVALVGICDGSWPVELGSNCEYTLEALLEQARIERIVRVIERR